MIEEKILSFVTDALISSSKQLDYISSKFFVGTRRLYVGTRITKFCNRIKQRQSNGKVDISQHSLLFEDLAEIGASLRTQCIFIFTLSLSLKLITAGLLDYEDSVDEEKCVKQSIQPKSELIELDNLPDDSPITPKPVIVINATKWLTALEYALKTLKTDDVINACICEEIKPPFDISQPEISLVKGMVESFELFVHKWKDTCNSCSQIEALTKAIGEVEMKVTDKMTLKRLKKYLKAEPPVMRSNPGIQVLATGLRAILEAIKDY